MKTARPRGPLLRLRSPRNPRLPALVAAALWLLPGCDIFDLDSTRLVAGTVFHFPEISTPAGGQSDLTLASVFFGEKEAGVDVFASPPIGILNADVNLVIFPPGESVLDVELSGLGDGTYTATSTSDPDLGYWSGASYRVEVDDFGDAFDVDVENAPAPEAPQGAFDGHSVGEPMTITRSQVRIAFIEVLRFEGGSPFLTYTNRPQTVQDILEVIADPSPYQAGSFEIPASAFEESGHHAVTLITAVRGVPDVGLYSGSGVLVGAGEVRIFEVE